MERALDCLPEMMNEPGFKEAWDALEPEYNLAATLIEARSKVGMTQADVAVKMGVSQPVVARLESGRNVSIKSIKRYASAIGQPISLVITPSN